MKPYYVFRWIIVYGNGTILKGGCYDDIDICARVMREQLYRAIQQDANNPRGFVTVDTWGMEAA